MSLEPIRNERHETVGYRQGAPAGRVDVRNKNGELVGWTEFGQTKSKDGNLVSFQENEGLL